VNRLKKIIAVIFAFVFSVTCFSYTQKFTISTYAESMSDLEAKQAELARQRKEIEQSMKNSEGKADEQDKYLAEYDERMKIQEQEIEVVKEQITLMQDNISSLEKKVDKKQIEVDDGIKLFRKRLRALYIAGNDSLASVLAGSTDFYDMLARMELVERVSKHDNDMIDELTTLIVQLQSDKADLERQLADLNTKKQEQEQYLADLQKTYNNHAETKAMYEKQAADYAARSEEIDAQEEQVEREIQELIRKQQEELERKRKEEEERRRQEEERRRKEAEANNETYTPSPDTSTSYPTYSETGFIWPVPTVRNISDGYGERWIVEEQRNNFHKGIDITKPGCYGEPIVASAAGTVITAANTGNGYGNHVIIDHGNGIATLYGHCSSLAVSAGDTVEQGQVIGYIGATGYAYGNHLHFEVRVNGQHTDPMNYVSIDN
jgi:murein DD-endopeptidase MepM/ murein hydrolase activator NlpD